MTERSTVNSSTILGANYEVITLTSNNYNPTIDEQVVITATVKDVYGDPITGKSLQLYLNGTSMGSEYISITNNQGIASFTVTVDTPGLNSFSVANSKLAINVTGWREVTLPSSVTSVSDCHLYVNDSLRLCDFKYYRTNYNFTKTSSITLHSDLVPEDYRPLVNVICASFNDVIVAGIITDGSLAVASSETGSKNINISATWHY